MILVTGGSGLVGKYLKDILPDAVYISSKDFDLTKMDREQFYKKELKIRMNANLPPVSKMAAIIVSCSNISEGQQVCLRLSQSMPKIDNVDFYGPAPAPLSRLKGKHRLRFLIHEKKGRKIQKIIQHWLAKVPRSSTVLITTDIDPHNFT